MLQKLKQLQTKLTKAFENTNLIRTFNQIRKTNNKNNLKTKGYVKSKKPKEHSSEGSSC